MNILLILAKNPWKKKNFSSSALFYMKLRVVSNILWVIVEILGKSWDLLTFIKILEKSWNFTQYQGFIQALLLRFMAIAHNPTYVSMLAPAAGSSYGVL